MMFLLGANAKDCATTEYPTASVLTTSYQTVPGISVTSPSDSYVYSGVLHGQGITGTAGELPITGNCWHSTSGGIEYTIVYGFEGLLKMLLISKMSSNGQLLVNSGVARYDPYGTPVTASCDTIRQAFPVGVTVPFAPSAASAGYGIKSLTFKKQCVTDAPTTSPIAANCFPSYPMASGLTTSAQVVPGISLTSLSQVSMESGWMYGAYFNGPGGPLVGLCDYSGNNKIAYAFDLAYTKMVMVQLSIVSGQLNVWGTGEVRYNSVAATSCAAVPGLWNNGVAVNQLATSLTSPGYGIQSLVFKKACTTDAPTATPTAIPSAVPSAMPVAEDCATSEYPTASVLTTSYQTVPEISVTSPSDSYVYSGVLHGQYITGTAGELPIAGSCWHSTSGGIEYTIVYGFEGVLKMLLISKMSSNGQLLVNSGVARYDPYGTPVTASCETIRQAFAVGEAVSFAPSAASAGYGIKSLTFKKQCVTDAPTTSPIAANCFPSYPMSSGLTTSAQVVPGISLTSLSQVSMESGWMYGAYFNGPGGPLVGLCDYAGNNRIAYAFDLAYTKMVMVQLSIVSGQLNVWGTGEVRYNSVAATSCAAVPGLWNNGVAVNQLATSLTSPGYGIQSLVFKKACTTDAPTAAPVSADCFPPYPITTPISSTAQLVPDLTLTSLSQMTVESGQMFGAYVNFGLETPIVGSILYHTSGGTDYNLVYGLDNGFIRMVIVLSNIVGGRLNLVAHEAGYKEAPASFDATTLKVTWITRTRVSVATSNDFAGVGIRTMVWKKACTTLSPTAIPSLAPVTAAPFPQTNSPTLIPSLAPVVVPTYASSTASGFITNSQVGIQNLFPVTTLDEVLIKNVYLGGTSVSAYGRTQMARVCQWTSAQGTSPTLRYYIATIIDGNSYRMAGFTLRVLSSGIVAAFTLEFNLNGRKLSRDFRTNTVSTITDCVGMNRAWTNTNGLMTAQCDGCSGIGTRTITLTDARKGILVFGIFKLNTGFVNNRRLQSTDSALDLDSSVAMLGAVAAMVGVDPSAVDIKSASTDEAGVVTVEVQITANLEDFPEAEEHLEWMFNSIVEAINEKVSSGEFAADLVARSVEGSVTHSVTGATVEMASSYLALSDMTEAPTEIPTQVPSGEPSAVPTLAPSSTPSTVPSFVPTIHPTGPSKRPTKAPTASPTKKPTPGPSARPSKAPTTRRPNRGSDSSDSNSGSGSGSDNGHGSGSGSDNSHGSGSNGSGSGSDGSSSGDESNRLRRRA